MEDCSPVQLPRGTARLGTNSNIRVRNAQEQGCSLPAPRCGAEDYRHCGMQIVTQMFIHLT